MAITPILTIFDSIAAEHDYTDDPVCSLVIFASMLATTVYSLAPHDASSDVCVFQWKSGEMLLVSGVKSLRFWSHVFLDNFFEGYI